MLVLTDDMPRWVMVEQCEKVLPPIGEERETKVPLTLLPTNPQYKAYYDKGVIKARYCAFVFQVQQVFGKKQWVFIGIEDE